MSTICSDLTFLPCAAWLKSELTESVSTGKPEKLRKELKVQGFWRQHRVALFSCQLSEVSTSFELYSSKMYLQNHQSTFCSWLFWLYQEKWWTGFKIIAVYIFSEVYAWLKQKANLRVLTERWLNCICSRNNVKTTNHTKGGHLKPLCAPSLSGQIPALLWAGERIAGEDLAADQQRWGLFPGCSPRLLVPPMANTSPEVQGEPNASGLHHTAGGFPSQQAHMCWEENFKKWTWLC